MTSLTTRRSPGISGWPSAVAVERAERRVDDAGWSTPARRRGSSRGRRARRTSPSASSHAADVTSACGAPSLQREVARGSPTRSGPEWESAAAPRRCAAPTIRRAGPACEGRSGALAAGSQARLQRGQVRRRPRLAAHGGQHRGVALERALPQRRAVEHRVDAAREREERSRSPERGSTTSLCSRHRQPQRERVGGHRRKSRDSTRKPHRQQSRRHQRQSDRKRLQHRGNRRRIVFGPREEARQILRRRRSEASLDRERLAPFPFRRQLVDRTLPFRDGGDGRRREQPVLQPARAVASSRWRRAISSPTRGRRDRDRARKDGRSNRDPARGGTSGSAFQSRASRASPCRVELRAPPRHARSRRAPARAGPRASRSRRTPPGLRADRSLRAAPQRGERPPEQRPRRRGTRRAAGATACVAVRRSRSRAAVQRSIRERYHSAGRHAGRLAVMFSRQ